MKNDSQNYQVIEAESKLELIELVCDLRHQGFEPVGGVAVVSAVNRATGKLHLAFYQAMWRSKAQAR